MTKGKQWTIQQETELKNLIDTNKNLQEIAQIMQKTPSAIILKCQRLGLKVQTKGYIDTALPLPKELLSPEKTLQMLAGALKTASKPGLNKLEVQRLQAIASIAKTYKDQLADFVNYLGIEAKLKEMEEQNEQLLKERSQNNAAKPDSGPMAQPSASQQ
jgi:hypothetical protein